jgi:hypothetical protein
MLHFFKAAPDQVRWELTATAIESGQSYRLAVHHSQGVIVEYFTTSAKAVIRVQELEDLLARARGPEDVTPVGVPS